MRRFLFASLFVLFLFHWNHVKNPILWPFSAGNGNDDAETCIKYILQPNNEKQQNKPGQQLRASVYSMP